MAHFLKTFESIGRSRHSSMVSSAPTIMQPQVRIQSTPSTLLTICIIEIVMLAAID